MTFIFICHAEIRTFSNPEGENYDRYQMKIDKRASALLREWADCVLFGNYDVAVDKKKGYGGERKIYANHAAAWDAKNRYSIEKHMSSDFMEFWKIYYNLIRKHTTLNFITPAQAAGINLNLQRNRFLSLIEILKNKTTISKTH